MRLPVNVLLQEMNSHYRPGQNPLRNTGCGSEPVFQEAGNARHHGLPADFQFPRHRRCGAVRWQQLLTSRDQTPAYLAMTPLEH
mmetsp:Transcript_21591/g.60004  ORF Transcript_21591/g.60004 Transcript_21591/m.60004 type:complete len:84 (+) Transcript_21591:163-414(+)